MIRALAHQRNRFEALAPAGASVVSRAGHILVAFVLAGTFALSAPAAAFAEVLESDEIGNKTVAARGLSADACPDIGATHAILVGSDGTVYFSRDVNAEVKIASLTKIMTAVVALENAPLDLTVTVDNEAATVGESSAGLLEGDTMSLETALYALMVPSGNDAGIAIAKSVGAHMSGDAATGYDTFIAAMNAKAADLGMSHSVYTNPHGLDFDAFGDEDLHSSARDVATLVSYAMQNDTFRGIVDAGSTTITVTSADGTARNVALQTTDELMGVYDGICGVKTGTTDDAGYCFAGAVSRDAGELYSVVLDSPSSDERFSDTVALMDWAYANIAQRSLVNSDQYVEYLGAHVPLVAKVAHNDWVDVAVDATVADPDLSANVFAAFGPVQAKATFNELSGDVHAGDVIGSLVFMQDDNQIAQTDIIAAEDVAAPNFFQGIGVGFDRWIHSIQHQPTVAETQECYYTQALSDR